MSLCSSALKAFCRVSMIKKNVLFNKYSLLQIQNINLIQERGMRKSYATILKVMKLRRKYAGPEKTRKRSEWLEWNYDAELYAFNKRLHEKITDETLRNIFIHDSYVRMEEQKRQDMVGQDVQFDLKSNSDLIAHGKEIMNKFIMRYVRVAFKYLPEEGVCAVRDYLISDEVLSHVSSNIGTKDLIFSVEYPPDKSTLAATLKALIGGIAFDDSVARAENFILDFVCPQLIGKDIFEIWEFDKPLQILNSILQKQGRESTESRLIFESGRNTIEAVYHVGLYSNKQFLGRGVGETLHFAEEMAAYDALRRLFHVSESNIILPLGEKARTLEFKSEKESVSLKEICNDSLDLLKSS